MKIGKELTIPFCESDILPYQTVSLTGEKVLVFAPHPDDETVGCGGTIASHCRHGDPVKIIILTNGDKADTRNRYSREEYVTVRKTEAQQAGVILGVNDIEFWGYPDRGLRPDENLISRISDLLKDYKPTLIYCPSPTEVHPDHRSTSQAVWKTILSNKYILNKMAFYELGIPFRPNTLVDITPYIEVKRKALKTYKSQQAENDYYNKILGLNKYRTYTLSPKVAYAEGYYIVSSERLKTTPFDTLELCIFQPLPRMFLGNNPLVSVIIGTNNRPQLLRNCLRSLLVQTYKSFEVVLVNDGGEDEEELIREFKGHLNINYIRHPAQKGRASALNTGIKNSRGQYIAFLDDNDIYYPNHLMILVKHLLESNCKVAYTSVISKTYKNGLTCELELVNEGESFDDDFDRNKILYEKYIPFIGVMVDRGVVEKIGYFDEEMKIHEDWDYWIRVSRFYNFVHIKETTAEYRYYEEKVLQPHNLNSDTDEWSFKLFHKNRRYISEGSLLQYTKTIAASLTDKDRQIQSLMQSTVNKDKHIQSLTHSIENKDILLNQICNSLGWQLIDSIRRWLNKYSPPGTKRRRLCAKVIKGIKFMT